MGKYRVWLWCEVFLMSVNLDKLEAATEGMSTFDRNRFEQQFLGALGATVSEADWNECLDCITEDTNRRKVATHELHEA